MTKSGRNDPCPCGSGRKFKKCHGSLENLDVAAQVARDAPLMFARAKAEQVQRERQQGLGKPIISAEVNGFRFIAVRNTLHYSEKWKTFHDFLADYIKIVMGKAWWMGEVAKADSDRHPILKWATATYEQFKPLETSPGQVHSAPMTGAAGALIHTAYDLYALAHHVALQDLLVKRLKNSANFAGARYEVAVAAKLLRAGFELELEDETDGTSTHVEFTATYKASGRKFSVEAKQRDADKLRIGRLLHRALTKAAPHDRIVFIDINEPDLAHVAEPPQFLVSAEGRLIQYEKNPSAAGLPPAYVIVTNAPWHHHPADTRVRHSALFHGFRIPQLQRGFAFRTIREAVDARSAHAELFTLFLSMQDHTEVPTTFDGENPELAFSGGSPRLVVGQSYAVEDGTGVTVEGVLESGIVLEQDQVAVCVLRLGDGRRVIQRFPLDDREVRAWRAHPDTFFGVVDRNARRGKVKTPLDWYDFFYESYRATPKEKLVEWMTGPLTRERLDSMSQEDLARLYCEGLAASEWKREEHPARPTKR